MLERSLFQGLASLFLPALAIHTLVNQTQKAISKQAKAHPILKKWGPSAAGLLCLPLLPVVFDDPIEKGLEKAFHLVWPLSPIEERRIKHHTDGHAKNHSNKDKIE